MKKKITHILYSGLGGHGSVFFSLTDADTASEFSYHALFTGIEPVRETYVEKCREKGIAQDFILKKSGFHPAIYWNIAKKLKAQKPSTVLLHGPSFIFAAVLYKLSRFSARVVVRDTQAHHLKTKMDWFWLGWAVLLAKKIIVLTPEAGEGIVKKFRWLPVKKKLVIIPNGLNIHRYQPVKNQRSTPVLIGMQSRLQRIKDHPTLLRAFHLLQQQLPGTDMRLHIAGDGETKEELMALANELGISDKVKFTGMLNEDDLLAFMQELDVYVHATQGETLSNSIMQAMACGLPVIASDVWGVNNMISPGKNGILYPPGNVEVLTSEMKELVMHQQKREEFAKASRRFAEDTYSNEVMFQRYRTLYN